jgi:hypothetical protein
MFPGFVYCSHNLNTPSSVLFIQGRSGALSNMDVCCDGIQDGPADDGRCDTDPSYLSITAFQWIVESYGVGNQTDLDANVHPYVVFGNTAEDGNDGWPTFDPQQYGIEPLSVMAVLCGGKLFYGIWGDMKGDYGDAAMVGEASISLATACYGMDMNGNHGYDGDDVLYLAFPGEDAVPGADGAKWDARNFDEFEASIGDLGDKLMKRLDQAREDDTEPDESENGGQDKEDDQDQSQDEDDQGQSEDGGEQTGNGNAGGSDDAESRACRVQPLTSVLGKLLR